MAAALVLFVSLDGKSAVAAVAIADFSLCVVEVN
jgi:hypothetical protein